MEKPKSKRFINGRSLNGNMKSHLPKTENQEDNHDTHEEEDDELGYDHKKAGSGSGSVILQDRESETDSSDNPILRRSKRIRRKPEALENLDYEQNQIQKKMKIVRVENEHEPDPVSSISCTSPDEDVAYCLMSMKNDKWVFKEDDDGDEEDEEEEVDSDSPENRKNDRKTRGKYKCETCLKIFRSYQALGGHRASHKKTRSIPIPTPIPIPTFEEQENDDQKIHECPVCYRVFASGQALGGHKRSHVIAAAAAAATSSIYRRPVPAKRKSNERMIDLNLPAPMEDDDDDHEREWGN